jgi:DMSO reductase anchor subunit
MLLTLPLILFMVMTELSVGAFAVLFLLDWRNMVKRNFLVTYAIIYVLLTGLTVLFQLNFSTPELLNTFTMLDKAWTGYLSLSLLLFLALMIPYTFFLLLDKKAGVDGKFKKEEEEVEGTRRSSLRLLRLVSGSLDVLAGVVTLFVLGMIFRPLAASGPAGAFVVGSFFAAALALGGVMTAMWLGHWYLVTPALSEKPLQFATTLVLIGVLAQVVFAFTGGLSSVTHSQASNVATPVVTATATTAVSAATPAQNAQVKPSNAPVVTPLSTDVIGWLRILVAFVLPLALLGFILKLIRDRSFQSATGMLYLVVVLTLAGEAMSRGLFLAGLQ